MLKSDRKTPYSYSVPQIKKYFEKTEEDVIKQKSRRLKSEIDGERHHGTVSQIFPLVKSGPLISK